MEQSTKASAVVAKSLLLLFVFLMVAMFLMKPSLPESTVLAQGERAFENAIPDNAPIAQEIAKGAIPEQNSALLPESWARKSAITKTMPVYPEEAVRLGVSGVVYVRFETSPEGEVVRIKVKPTTHPLLSKAVVEAVKDWRFEPWRGADGLTEPVFSRLAFNFLIATGVPTVEMYRPGARQRTTECLECSNSNKEMSQWRDWDEAWSNSNPRVIDSP